MDNNDGYYKMPQKKVAHQISQKNTNFIEQDEQLSQTLPIMRGLLKKKGKKGLNMCVLRNRKFKYYKDLECKQVAGVIDFERINCVVMIDEEVEIY